MRRFSTNNCDINVYGNILSLVTTNYINNTIIKGQTFNYLFSGTNIINAKNLILLPTLNGSSGHYQSLFENCTKLITPPELPALSVPLNGYEKMFKGCISLEYTPILPAYGLDGTNYPGTGPYKEMFENCTNLKLVCYLADYTYLHRIADTWLYNVAKNGIFVVKSRYYNDWYWRIQFAPNCSLSGTHPIGWNTIAFNEDVEDFYMNMEQYIH